jgi:O-antigen/teichoic acid export membrane protein
MSQEEPAATFTPVDARQAALDVMIQIVGRVLNLALGVVVTVVFVRSLGDRAFGEWSSIIAVTQVFQYLAAQGFASSAVRFATVDREHEPEWLSAALLLRTALGFPAALLSTLTALLLIHGHEGTVAAVVLSALIIPNAPTMLGVVFQTRVRNWVNISLLSAFSIAWGAAVVAIAVTGRASLASYAIALAGVSLTINAVQVILALRQTSLRRPSGEQLRRVSRIGFALGFGALLVLMYGRIDQVIVYRVAGASQAGYYAAAYRLLDQAQLVPIAITTTLLPIIVAAHRTDPQRLRRAVQASFDYLSIASLPALAIGIAAGRPTMTLLFGSSFAKAGDALAPLMGAFVVISFGYILGQLVVVLDLQRLQIFFALGALVLNVALNLALVPTYGFRAAAWVTLATELLVTVLTARAVLPRLELRLTFARFNRTVLAAGIMTGVGFAVRSVDGRAIPIIGASVVAYVICCFALKIISKDDLQLVLAKRTASSA